ncbi:MAG TPA: M28 family peptidase, partial [Acidobacteriota bacterium]|nr:M28 family peptidase [Acidobacteriota bacterium]
YLKEQGIPVTGMIALVRARGVCRSMKVLAAEKEGVAGLLIYPELRDQGFLKPEFPYGPHLNPWTIQRGTLLKYFLHPGDPQDPDAQAISSLPKIPALPISSNIASTLLSHLQGNDVPEDWKGWLPQKYRTGPGPALVRLTYKGKNESRTIRNIFASIDGADSHFIVAGNHYDAWVYGASDPSSGTSTLLETLRVLANLVQNGWKPQRKILFAFWDGEEYGMFGSTKWVKNNLDGLKQAIAYVNVDSAFRARDLAAYVSPGLHSSFDQALKGLKEPDSGRYFSEIRPEFQNPGFSGDTAPFVRFAGLPVVDAGFGRTYSVYHSLYDDELWMEKFGDPRASYRSALARILARYLLRLSSDPVIPYDFSEFQPYAVRALNKLKQRWPNKSEWDSATKSLYDEMARFNSVAIKLNNKKSLQEEEKKRLNELLVQAMNSFYDQRTGKGVLMETSSKLGCVGEALPRVSEASESRNISTLKIEVGVLTKKFLDARQFLEEADSLAKK